MWILPSQSGRGRPPDRHSIRLMESLDALAHAATSQSRRICRIEKQNIENGADVLKLFTGSLERSRCCPCRWTMQGPPERLHTRTGGLHDQRWLKPQM
jgi:hypothetical protein